ncbi:hypothetical protein GTY56_11855 [Streptomyces sp. SID5643]|nr:hypothetical protein [Streptomyces sp. SID5643]
MTSFRNYSRGATHYRRGPFFLAGDAAHIQSPAGGQGMNTGIQDALNLGWELAHVCRGAAPEELPPDRGALGRAPARETACPAPRPDSSGASPDRATTCCSPAPATTGPRICRWRAARPGVRAPPGRAEPPAGHHAGPRTARRVRGSPGTRHRPHGSARLPRPPAA